MHINIPKAICMAAAIVYKSRIIRTFGECNSQRVPISNKVADFVLWPNNIEYRTGRQAVVE